MAYFVPKYSHRGFLPAKIWLNKFQLIYVKQDATAQSMIRCPYSGFPTQDQLPAHYILIPKMQVFGSGFFCLWTGPCDLFWIRSFNISSFCFVVYFVTAVAVYLFQFLYLLGYLFTRERNDREWPTINLPLYQIWKRNSFVQKRFAATTKDQLSYGFWISPSIQYQIHLVKYPISNIHYPIIQHIWKYI